MKLLPAILTLSILGIVSPVAGVAQQGLGNELGQKARLEPVTLAQAAAPATAAIPADYLLKTCMEGGVGGTNLVSPGIELVGELLNRSRETIHDEEIVAREAAVKLTLLVAPIHGKLVPQPSYKGIVYYQYQNEPDYVGKDKVVFLAEFAGKRYKIVYNLIVVKQIDERNPQCPEAQLIKLQNKPASGSSSYDLNSVTVTFADLPGGAIGQTNVSGTTLDDNAASYNWFIDPTPADNSEYHPTSSPFEWVAKADKNLVLSRFAGRIQSTGFPPSRE